jgi:mannose-6-phosphate isomerase-like protein (cupin superfamily)
VARRVLAANVDGRSRVIADQVGLSNQLVSVRGFDPLTVWLHAPGKALVAANAPKAGEQIIPPPRRGATICLVTFPPDRWAAESSADPAAVGAELATRLPGLAETFEPNNPGMHTTPTTDVGFVICGHPVCTFDDSEVRLHPGDVILQQRTRHGWRNPGDEPATIAFVLFDDP